jgi:hypothetical protein
LSHSSRYPTGLKICKSLFAAVHESAFGTKRTLPAS